MYGLVHIPGFGDYQMSKIEKLKDPFSFTQKKSGVDIQMDDVNSIENIYTIEDPSKQVIKNLFSYFYHIILIFFFFLITGIARI